MLLVKSVPFYNPTLSKRIKACKLYSKALLTGFETFRGKVLHSHSYKKPFEFQDKKVVVIGIGNSGADIAVDLAHHSEKVSLCH